VPIRRVRLALLGYGRVGQALAQLINAECARLRSDGFDLELVGALIRDPLKSRYGPSIPLRTSPRDLLAGPVDVLIDVMGGEHPALDIVSRALDAGIHVVTANKTLVAGHGEVLSAHARRRAVGFAYDAAVLAGVPFLGALARRPLIGAPDRITGIVNGTSHFIVDEIAAGGSLAAALEEAKVRGYAEPDSSADLSGRDAAEKLTILLHLAGCRSVRVSDLMTCRVEALTGADVLGARAIGGVIKPAALASLHPANPGAWVGPAVFDAAHPFAALSGVQNALEFAGSAGDPVTFAGPGAGPRVTAGTILDDVAEVLGAPSPGTVAAIRREPVPAEVMRRPPRSEWFVRTIGSTVSAGDLAAAFTTRQLPAPIAIVECGRALIARTGEAAWPAIADVVSALHSHGADTLALPIVPAKR
jgi:homoserine dehydrogenase